MTTIQAISRGESHFDADACIYYPLWFVEVSVRWRRLILSSRTETIVVCVDAVRGVAYRVDVLPGSVKRDVPDDRVMPARIELGGAAGHAADLARWWAGTRFLSWWAPQVESGTVRLLHKVYVIEENTGRAALRDSLSGEVETL